MFIAFENEGQKYLLGATYIRPQSHLCYFDSHITTVEELTQKYPDHKVILTGDYNLPQVQWNNDSIGTSASYNPELISNSTGHAADVLSDSFAALGMFQRNYICNSNGYALDLIFTNFQTPDCQKVLDPLKKLDTPHPAISLKFTSEPYNLNKNKLHYSHTVYDFKKADYESINNKLNTLNWDTLLDQNCNDVEEIVEKFYQTLFQICDEFIPKKTLKPKTNHYPHWFSTELIDLIQRKKRIHKIYKEFELEDDYDAFSILRARCKKLTNECYLEYIKKVEESISNNVKGFWNHVNLNRGDDGIPSSMSLNAVNSSDGDEIVNMFASHFESVYSDKTLPPIQVNPPTENLFNVNSVSIDEVKTKLKDIDINKGPGTDGIPPIFLKNCSTTLAYPLTILFNISLRTCSFPKIWKNAHLSPIFKSGNKNDIKNYRPISIISTIHGG